MKVLLQLVLRYYDMRMVKNMGGIGAHHDADYDTLKRFVEDPWMCKETMQAGVQKQSIIWLDTTGYLLSFQEVLRMFQKPLDALKQNYPPLFALVTGKQVI